MLSSPTTSLSSSMPSSPYFSKFSFAILGPVAVVYSLLSRVLYSLLPDSSIYQPPPVRQLPPPPLPQSQSQSHMVAIVTGSNTGIGYETAKTLVQQYGWTVILACRSRDKAIQAGKQINNDNDNASVGSSTSASGGKAIFVHPLDLSSAVSIREFVQAVQQSIHPNIHVLINNAGRNTNGRIINNNNNNNPSNNIDLDLLFQSNFLGHYLLTALLMGRQMLSSHKQKREVHGSTTTKVVPPRVINLSSVMHHFCKDQENGDDDCLTKVHYWRAVASADQSPVDTYALSKLAALLFTVELNQRYGTNNNDSNSNNNDDNDNDCNKQVRLQSIAVNPGAVNSDIWRGFPRFIIPIFRLLYLTPEQGSRPVVAAATQQDWSDHPHQDNNDNNNHLPLYLQPYWIPPFFSGTSTSSPPYPVLEMLGPYVGYVVTTPRLPAGDDDANGGSAAAKALWKASQELTGCHWPE